MVGNRRIARFGHGVGTERRYAASAGHDPRISPTVRTAPTLGPHDQWSRFRPDGQAWGTAPNGHFDAALKTAGHGLGTKWAQDGHKAKRRPFGAAHIQF